MIRSVLAVLAIPSLGMPIYWMASQSPGGRLAQAGIAAIGYTAVAGIIQAVMKGTEHARRTH